MPLAKAGFIWPEQPWLSCRPVYCSPVKEVTVPFSPSFRSIVVSFIALFAATMLSVSATQAFAAPVLVADTASIEQGVVRIDTTLDLQNAVGTGTGVVLSPDGIVLTNNHVIRGADNITATNVGNGQTYPVEVLGYDRKSDIAVLRLTGSTDLPVAPTADSAGLQIGDPVTALGFPEGAGLTRAPGTVRALNQSIVANDDLTGSSEELTDLVDFDADIRPGDSGGPLADPDGRVVGIVTAASQNYRMMSTGGFAIPLNRALSIADAVRSGDSSGAIHIGPTAILGVAIGSGRDDAGVTVVGVLRGSAADQAGLAGGDVITSVDDTTISDGTVLTDVLDRHHPGDTVSLTYVDRQGNPRSVPVTLAPGPPN
jgi:S1-C subfamily serine protease